MDEGYVVILALLAVYAVSSLLLYLRGRGYNPEPKSDPGAETGKEKK